ncbi:hypothetical protein IQ07DRAFT_595746 [Pyrenochaeta sp. DS3sAY3a]|nr:hypothetical protein IQ07DRAFT_595746 [Pyrenochaeta sp. DS3sAY3a]
MASAEFMPAKYPRFSVHDNHGESPDNSLHPIVETRTLSDMLPPSDMPPPSRPQLTVSNWPSHYAEFRLSYPEIQYVHSSLLPPNGSPVTTQLGARLLALLALTSCDRPRDRSSSRFAKLAQEALDENENSTYERVQGLLMIGYHRLMAGEIDGALAKFNTASAIYKRLGPNEDIDIEIRRRTACACLMMTIVGNAFTGGVQ